MSILFYPQFSCVKTMLVICISCTGVGATFGFQQQSYLVNEDAGSLSLCIAFAGDIPSGQTATFMAATEDGSATGIYVYM